MYRLFMLILGLSLATGANGSEAPDRLAQFLAGLHTLEAQFDQILEAPGQAAPLVSRGTLYLSRPGRFRWSYTQPEGQLVVADGSRVWLYDPDLEQVSHQSQEEALRGTPALLLSDDGPVDRHFEVVDLDHRQGLDWVELIPKAENSEIVKVLIGFRGERLDRLEMIDNFGQSTRFQFHNVQRNPDLDPALFRFDPPPSVDILGR
jgi:outer membrane lipoprotein carrier protein